MSLLSQSTQSAGLIGDKIATLAVGGASERREQCRGCQRVGERRAEHDRLDGGWRLVGHGRRRHRCRRGRHRDHRRVRRRGRHRTRRQRRRAWVSEATTSPTPCRPRSAPPRRTAPAGNVVVTASETANIEGIVIGLGAGANVGVAASLSVGVIANHVTAQIGDNATVTAAKAVTVRGTDDAGISIVAGQVAVGGDVGVGASPGQRDRAGQATRRPSRGWPRLSGRTGVVDDAETGEQISIGCRRRCGRRRVRRRRLRHRDHHRRYDHGVHRQRRVVAHGHADGCRPRPVTWM